MISLNQTQHAPKNIPLSIVWFCENVDFMNSALQPRSLLEDVEKFLVSENISATQFGALAVGDTKFVNTLRKGRKAREATTERVRTWMKAQGAS